MEEVNFREIFEKDCFEPSVSALMQRTGEALSGIASQVSAAFADPLCSFIGSVLEYCKGNPGLSLKRVTLSFMRTSLYLDQPTLLAEAYEGVPFMAAPIMSCRLDAAWMFRCWEEYHEEVSKKIRERAVGRYVRKPELKAYDSRAVTILLCYLAPYLKYMVRELERRPEWEELERIKDFTVSYGEYMDWQFPLCVVREEIDPFLCDEGEDMTFRRFRNMCYREKAFGDLDMDDCVFQGCTFEKVEFEGTKLRGVRFMDCVFEDCRFHEVELAGSSILSSRIRRAVFDGCSFLAGFYRKGQGKIPFPAVSFRWSLLESVRMEGTPTEAGMFADCQIFEETEERNEIL